jgi:hypothetical protein
MKNGDIPGAVIVRMNESGMRLRKRLVTPNEIKLLGYDRWGRASNVGEGK